MKLFYLSQDTVRGYDTYSDCVVCAEDEKDAVSIDPSTNNICPTDKLESYPSWCLQKDVSAEYIGEAVEGLQRGVICSSFHAG